MEVPTRGALCHMRSCTKIPFAWPRPQARLSCFVTLECASPTASELAPPLTTRAYTGAPSRIEQSSPMRLPTPPTVDRPSSPCGSQTLRTAPRLLGAIPEMSRDETSAMSLRSPAGASAGLPHRTA